MFYKVITAISISGIEKQANTLISDGWIPTGGIAKTSFGQYVQAMYRPQGQ